MINDKLKRAVVERFVRLGLVVELAISDDQSR
jgi:hypothetical protein